MIAPNKAIAIGALFLVCISLLAFEKENVTIRGSFENSRFAFESKMKGTVAFMGGSITRDERISSDVDGISEKPIS